MEAELTVAQIFPPRKGRYSSVAYDQLQGVAFRLTAPWTKSRRRWYDVARYTAANGRVCVGRVTYRDDVKWPRNTVARPWMAEAIVSGLPMSTGHFFTQAEAERNAEKGGKCYTNKGTMAFPSVQRRYAKNMQRFLTEGPDAFVKGVVSEIRRRGLGLVRVHVSGDFFVYRPGQESAYVDAWRRIALQLPSVRFWAYTKSFVVPSLRGALEELERVPNFVLFASVDPSTVGEVPAGWRRAYIAGTPGAPSFVCPEQRGIRESCAQCTLCFRGVSKSSKWGGSFTLLPH